MENGTAPTEEELSLAPVIEEWRVMDVTFGRTTAPQIFGTFRGHPTIPDGQFAHTSDVIYLDDSDPARWAICASRTYILGTLENGRVISET